MVGVEYEQHFKRPRQYPIRAVFRFRHPKHHAEKILRIGKIVVGVHIRHSETMPVCECGDCRNLPDKSPDLFLAGICVENILCFRIERRQRRKGAYEDPHGMGVITESIHESLHVLMDKGVHPHVLRPLMELCHRRKLAVQYEIGHLQIRALFRQLVDGIAAIQKDPFFAVDERDLAPAGRGVHERRVICHQAKILGSRLDLPEVDGFHGSVFNWNFVTLPRSRVRDLQCFERRPCWNFGRGLFSDCSRHVDLLRC